MTVLFLSLCSFVFLLFCNEPSSIYTLDTSFEREKFIGDSILIYLLITLGQISSRLSWIKYRGSLMRHRGTVPRPRTILNICKNQSTSTNGGIHTICLTITRYN